MSKMTHELFEKVKPKLFSNSFSRKGSEDFLSYVGKSTFGERLRRVTLFLAALFLLCSSSFLSAANAAGVGHGFVSYEEAYRRFGEKPSFFAPMVTERMTMNLSCLKKVPLQNGKSLLVVKMEIKRILFEKEIAIEIDDKLYTSSEEERQRVVITLLGKIVKELAKLNLIISPDRNNDELDAEIKHELGKKVSGRFKKSLKRSLALSLVAFKWMTGVGYPIFRQIYSFYVSLIKNVISLGLLQAINSKLPYHATRTLFTFAKNWGSKLFAHGQQSSEMTSGLGSFLNNQNGLSWLKSFYLTSLFQKVIGSLKSFRLFVALSAGKATVKELLSQPLGLFALVAVVVGEMLDPFYRKFTQIVDRSIENLETKSNPIEIDISRIVPMMVD
jgi:hypothetical protein